MQFERVDTYRKMPILNSRNGSDRYCPISARAALVDRHVAVSECTNLEFELRLEGWSVASRV